MQERAWYCVVFYGLVDVRFGIRGVIDCAVLFGQLPGLLFVLFGQLPVAFGV